MKRSMVFILFFVSAPVLLSARVIQQLYMIDPVTGFYLDGFGGIGTAISVLCFALIFVTLAMVWLSHPQEPAVPKKSPAVGVCACFAGACLITSSVGRLLQTATADRLVGVLGIIAAISLAWYGFSLISGGRFAPIMTIAPIVYACLRLVLDFIGYTGEVTVTDTVFGIVTMCLVLLFFYTSGKLISDVGGKRTHILFYSYGLVAAFFCADAAFVRIILALTHSNAALHGNSGFDVAFVGLAVYIVALVWKLSAPQKVSTEPAAVTEAEELSAHEQALRSLDELRSAGLLTNEEYAARRAEIIDNI